MILSRYVVAALVVSLSASAVRAQNEDREDLKVTRVALFSSGVGFFECSATVDGEKTAELTFRTDQINDILKSLVLEDFDGGTVGAVSYASRDPVEKALKSFGVDITGKPTLGQLLDQLRGEPVEISGPRQIAGVIVGVEKKRSPIDKTTTIEVDVLNVLTDNGIVQLSLDEVQGIKLSNAKTNAELSKALATVAASHDADKKSVVLHFDGQGQRRVRASYLLEAPIWKTSYRLVLSPEGKPFLQGWATVENATEEDWKDVRLSLISGRPISFTMDLYTPLYIPRPHEELELYASLRPPTLEAGFEAEKSKSVALGDKLFRARGGRAAAPPAADARMKSLGYLDEAEQQDRNALGLADAGVASVASAQEAGELFEYAIQTPVTISRQHSAMLPIVNQDIEGQKVSIYNPTSHPKHPLNGLELKNTSGLHLMQGPVTLFDGNVYAGDAKLPDLSAGEKRLLAYALDLSMEVMVERSAHPVELVGLKIGEGTLWRRHKYVDERKYVIKNKDDKPRVLLIEQAYTADWKLLEPSDAYERTPSLLRFKLTIPAGASVSQRVVLERIADETLALTDMDFNSIHLYLGSRAASPALRAALERVIALRTDLDEAARQRANIEQQLNETVQEQARIRENLKTLRSGGDSYAKQERKFDALEDQIASLREELKKARMNEERKRAALRDYLAALTIE